MIRQKEFPHLFKNDVVKNQRMSKFFQEQDYESEVECISKNKEIMLKDLFAGIARYQKSDPSKLIENLKEPFSAAE